jgi:hypothetical protein
MPLRPLFLKILDSTRLLPIEYEKMSIVALGSQRPPEPKNGRPFMKIDDETTYRIVFKFLRRFETLSNEFSLDPNLALSLDLKDEN